MNCHGLFGRLFGHNYEGRYTIAVPGGLQLGNFDGPQKAYVAMVEVWKSRIYVCDVCTRCGHVAKEAA